MINLLNIGIISNWLNGALVVIGFGGLIFFSNKIFKASTEESIKVEKAIDLFKYTLMSVAAVCIVSIITNLFKEREQELKELEYFDKYVNKVIQKNTEERYEIAKYLSIVAPNGDFKKAWKSYFDSISKSSSYIKIDSVNQKIIAINNDTTKSDSIKVIETEKLNVEKAFYNKPIVKEDPIQINRPIRLDIFYLENKNAITNKKKAEDLATQLNTKFYDIRIRPLPEKTNSSEGYKIYENQFRYDVGEEDKATVLENDLNNISPGMFYKKLTSNITNNYLSIFIVK